MVRRPYLGEILERASAKQRANSFSCDKIGFIQRLPQKWEQSPKWLREQYMEKYYEYRTYEKNQVSQTQRLETICSIAFIDLTTYKINVGYRLWLGTLLSAIGFWA